MIEKSLFDACDAVPLSAVRDVLHHGPQILAPQASYTQVVGLPIGEGCLIPKGSLRYVAPCAGGWGIARGAMQVPGSIVIFQAPCGCGRHGSVAAVMNGYRDRMYYVDISEDDLVMGTHMERLEAIVDRVLRLRAEKPSCVWLFSTCIDDLLGSDYANVCARMAERYGIPFMDGHMDPVSMSSTTPPPVKLQRGIYGFLTQAGPVEKDPKAVNVMGNFAPVDETSELFNLLAAVGLSTVRSLPTCATFDEFLRMREGSRNILLKPFGRHACRDLEAAFGTPWHLTGMPYDVERVAAMYRDLGAFLEQPLPFEPYYEQAVRELEQARSWMEGLNVAVGSNLNGSTFEVAATLAAAGANITFLLAEEMEPGDLPYIEALCAVNPQIPVYSGSHPRMSLVREVGHPTDVAVGLDTARLVESAAPLSLGVDVQPFGFEASRFLLEGVRQALEKRGDARTMLYSQTLVV